MRRFIQFVFFVSIAGVLLWNILEANNVFSSADLQDSLTSATDSDSMRKPGEPEGYVPSPVPDFPTPRNVSIIEPGMPIPTRARPSQEELDKLNNRTIPPDSRYLVHLPFEHVIPDSKTAATNSNTIVLARVLKIHPSRWLTPDGNRPFNPFDFENPTFIYTLVDVSIQDQYKGNSSNGDVLTLFVMGGQVGEDMATSDDYRYKFSVGDVGLLYLDLMSLEESAKMLITSPVWYVREKFEVDLSTNIATSRSIPPQTRALQELLAEIPSPAKK